ncbi:hypothetical protein V1512DRAFT_262866 [Lipomyces arxii]|uniref:mitochondrial 37S ribosomal protein uS7m n=1 Tax=Lipomyces arxii TaxID=56418 RepID=UPI0034CE38EE
MQSARAIVRRPGIARCLYLTLQLKPQVHIQRTQFTSNVKRNFGSSIVFKNDKDDKEPEIEVPVEVEQGTPVAEIFARDPEAPDSLPEIVKEQIVEKEETEKSEPEIEETPEVIIREEGFPEDAEGIAPEVEQGIPVEEIIRHEKESLESSPSPEAVQQEEPAKAPEPSEIESAKSAEELLNFSPEILPEGSQESEQVAEQAIESVAPTNPLSSPEPIAATPESPSVNEVVFERTTEQEENKLLASLAAHLMMLRKSGLKIDDYVQSTGATELNATKGYVSGLRALKDARETEILIRERDGDMKIHDKGWQMLQSRKIKEFPQETEKDKENDVVEFLVNLVMRDGKKTVARRLVSEALVILRLRTREDPVRSLFRIVDEIAPIVKIEKYRSGAKTINVPKALTRRQRNRRALMWILEDAKKRPSPSFGVRLGDTLVAMRLSLDREGGVASERKNVIHKQAMENRANLPRIR